MPYRCKFCGNYFCSKHRLPENHECMGLTHHKEKAKEKLSKNKGSMEYMEDLKTESRKEKRSKRRVKKQENLIKFRPNYIKNLLTRFSWPGKLFWIFLALSIVFFSRLVPENLMNFGVYFSYVSGVSALWYLFKKINNARAETDLVIWGFRLLGLAFAIVGGILLFYSSMFVLLVPQLKGTWFYAMLGIGFLALGAFTEFRFKRKSGHIIYAR